MFVVCLTLENPNDLCHSTIMFIKGKNQRTNDWDYFARQHWTADMWIRHLQFFSTIFVLYLLNTVCAPERTFQEVFIISSKLHRVHYYDRRNYLLLTQRRNTMSGQENKEEVNNYCIHHFVILPRPLFSHTIAAWKCFWWLNRNWSDRLMKCVYGGGVFSNNPKFWGSLMLNSLNNVNISITNTPSLLFLTKPCFCSNYCHQPPPHPPQKKPEPQATGS